MKSYYVTLNNVTLLVDANGLENWINYLLELGRVPSIEKVEEVA